VRLLGDTPVHLAFGEERADNPSASSTAMCRSTFTLPVSGVDFDDRDVGTEGIRRTGEARSTQRRAQCRPSRRLASSAQLRDSAGVPTTWKRPFALSSTMSSRSASKRSAARSFAFSTTSTAA